MLVGDGGRGPLLGIRFWPKPKMIKGLVTFASVASLLEGNDSYMKIGIARENSFSIFSVINHRGWAVRIISSLRSFALGLQKASFIILLPFSINNSLFSL